MKKYESQDIVTNYVKHRPKLDKKIGTIIKQYLEKGQVKTFNKKWETLVDVGCGSGQATELLAPYFNNVYGFDISENQIKMAKLLHKNKGYHFAVGKAEDLPIASESVDLVSCSVAAHWLDYDKFVQETWRVLKPNGVVAIFSYFPPSAKLTFIDPNHNITSEETIKKASDLLEKFHSKCHNHPRVLHHFFDQKYDDIHDNLPAKDKISDTSVVLKYEWTLENLKGLYKSYDGYETFVIAKTKELASRGQEFTAQDDILEGFIQELKDLWGFPQANNEEVPISFECSTRIILGRK